MALGRADRERQEELWIAADQIVVGAGHAFYDRLNQVLKDAGFDRFVEELCAPRRVTELGRRSSVLADGM